MVVKEIYLKQNNSRIIEAVLREHKNLKAAGLPSEIMYDPEHKKMFFTMPLYAGRAVRSVVEEYAAKIIEAQANNDEKTARATTRELFGILLITLEAADRFHQKSNLVHGDAHLANVIIENNLKVAHLIDYGGCCVSGMNAKQYAESGIIVGSGGYYTPPEIPSTALVNDNEKYREYQAPIGFKSDLHSLIADFVVVGLTELQGFNSHDSNNMELSDIISDLSNWALLHAANSDWVYSNLSRGHKARLTQQRHALMQEHNATSTIELRASIPEAIAKVKALIDKLDILVRLPEGVKFGNVAAKIKQFETPYHIKKAS